MSFVKFLCKNVFRFYFRFILSTANRESLIEALYSKYFLCKKRLCRPLPPLQKSLHWDGEGHGSCPPLLLYDTSSCCASVYGHPFFENCILIENIFDIDKPKMINFCRYKRTAII